jgi:hypothetical protein
MHLTFTALKGDSKQREIYFSFTKAEKTMAQKIPLEENLQGLTGRKENTP